MFGVGTETVSVQQFRVTAVCASPELHAWQELRFALHPIALGEVAMRATRPFRQTGALAPVFRALDRWTRAGLIERIVTNRGEEFLMSESARRLREPPASARPIRKQVRSGRARMWSAIRVLKSFDLVELCTVAECGPITATGYMRLLERAGYIARTSPRGELARWRLLRHTGPKNPGAVRDPMNRNRIVALADRNTGDRHPMVDRDGQSSFFLAPGVNHVR